MYDNCAFPKIRCDSVWASIFRAFPRGLDRDYVARNSRRLSCPAIVKPVSYFSTAHCARTSVALASSVPSLFLQWAIAHLNANAARRPVRRASSARQTLTILLFYVCTGPWTRLKVSQQSSGRETWFKTGTISQGIALRRLTSAVCTRARSLWPFALSLFLFPSLSASFSWF